jgi:hypothetical protein
LKKLAFLYVGQVPEVVSSEKWKHFLISLGFEFEYESSDKLPNLADCKYQAIRFDSDFIYEAYKKVKGANPLMVQLKAVDFLYFKNKENWPKLVLREGLHSAILHKHPQLNAREGGLIVGSGHEAKIAASILVALGFSHISFVENEEKIPKNFIEEMKLTYFRVNIEILSPDKVILLPGIYSVIINTWDISKESELLTDLLYFNYLKKPGLVINLKKPKDHDLLIEEAKAISEKTIELKEIQTFIELASIRPFVELSEKKVRDFAGSVPIS